MAWSSGISCPFLNRSWITLGSIRFFEKLTRHLSPDECSRLLDTLEDQEGRFPYQVRLIRLLLLTGARLREVLNCRWGKDAGGDPLHSYLDLDGARIVCVDHKGSRRGGPKDGRHHAGRFDAIARLSALCCFITTETFRAQAQHGIGVVPLWFALLVMNRMSEALIPVHTEFALKLYRLGMPLIKLHAVGEDGVCKCWKRSQCGNAGKHPSGNSVLLSLVRSEEGLLDHVVKGGNLGLGMYFPHKPKVPRNPIRIYAFDDDDGTGIAWLAERGITSFWVVKGRKGYHVWAVLPDEAPDLFTKNNVFKEDRARETIAGAAFTMPKMDLRTTGLMVLPMDNGKTLLIDGVQVTVANRHLMDRFDSIETLLVFQRLIGTRK